MMFKALIFSMIVCPWPCETLAAMHEKVALNSFIQTALANGFPDKFLAPIADLTGISRNAGYYGLAISSDQATDGMFHAFRVIVDSANKAKPVGLLLQTGYAWSRNDEGYSYRVSLDGEIEKAVLLHSKLNDKGKTIKGAGVITEKDIHSHEIKERFQHEMDFWLKKTYLKKEWRSAGFSAGILQKKIKVQ